MKNVFEGLDLAYNDNQINENFLQVTCSIAALVDVLGLSDEQREEYNQRYKILYSEALFKINQQREANR